ncbi:MAG: septum formation protein Maf [Oscillospiraceae bacterium]|nr:septum formation protein Maf [Oscillospiraceae bacterium]
MARFVLASASPRRRELLEMLGLDFEVVPAPSEEEPDLSLPVEEAIAAVAAAKARSVPSELPVLAADTVVVIDGRILGKPSDEAEAAAMLRTLSGARHDVYTGVAVCFGGKMLRACQRTAVRFRELTDGEIRAYVSTGEPMDKAGAYGAQGLGALLIDRIDGDFFNVMGLPLCLTGKLLAEAGIEVLREMP